MSQLWPFLIPALATVLVSIIGAAVTISGRKREGRVNEVSEAFEHRGKLVDALHERLELVERREKECQDRLENMRKDLDEARSALQLPTRRER